MRSVRFVLSLCVLLLGLSGCGTVYRVERVDSVDTGSTGAYYRLPKNLVVLSIPITTTTTEKGRLAAYKDACGIPGKFRPAGTAHKLGTPAFNLIAIPDPSALFRVDLSTPVNPFASRSATLKLGDDLIIKEFSASGTDYSADAVLSLVETIANLSGAFAGGAPIGAIAGCVGEADTAKQRIAEINDALLDLAAGQTNLSNVDVKTYEQFKKDLQAERQTLLGYFLGEQTKNVRTLHIQYDPDHCVDKQCRVPLIDLVKNAALKLSPALVQTGQHAYKHTGSHGGGFKGNVSLHVRRADSPSASTDLREAGFYYRIPGRAEFGLEHAGVRLATRDLSVAQYGSIHALPRRFGLLKSEIKEIKLNPLLGSIESLNVNGENLKGEQIAALNKAVTAVAKDRTVEELEREKTILTLRKEIRELREAE